jgi:HSP20 family protein
MQVVSANRDLREPQPLATAWLNSAGGGAGGEAGDADRSQQDAAPTASMLTNTAPVAASGMRCIKAHSTQAHPQGTHPALRFDPAQMPRRKAMVKLHGIPDPEVAMTNKTPTKDLLPSLQRTASSAFAPLQRELNRFFEDLGEGWGAMTELKLSPRIDAIDTDKGLEVTVELPGLKKDDVKITAEDDMLTISGEKKSQHETREDNYRMVERSYGQFSRSIYLPRSLEPAKISASMSDGILKVFVPKRDGVQTKTIEIQST